MDGSAAATNRETLKRLVAVEPISDILRHVTQRRLPCCERIQECVDLGVFCQGVSLFLQRKPLVPELNDNIAPRGSRGRQVTRAFRGLTARDVT